MLCRAPFSGQKVKVTHVWNFERVRFVYLPIFDGFASYLAGDEVSHTIFRSKCQCHLWHKYDPWGVHLQRSVNEMLSDGRRSHLFSSPTSDLVCYTLSIIKAVHNSVKWMLFTCLLQLAVCCDYDGRIFSRVWDPASLWYWLQITCTSEGMSYDTHECPSAMVTHESNY